MEYDPCGLHCQSFVKRPAFSPVHRGCGSAPGLSESLMGFAFAQYFAAPSYSERIVGLRLGLLGLYRDKVLFATRSFHSEMWRRW
ncbi:hypothetical protein ACVWZK_001489 [Bradyrhizobium sp. GM0.4]